MAKHKAKHTMQGTAKRRFAIEDLQSWAQKNCHQDLRNDKATTIIRLTSERYVGKISQTNNASQQTSKIDKSCLSYLPYI